MTYYISGPMRGLPRLGFDAFHACADWLRAHGHQAHDPAAVDEALGFDPDLPLEDQRFSLHDAMRRDFLFIISPFCSGVVVLPGWERSVGARAEVVVAREVGLPVLAWRPDADDLEPVLNPIWTVVGHD